MQTAGRRPPTYRWEAAVLTALFVFVAIALTVSVITVVMVSVCSRLEDARWTLGGPPPGSMRALTRRIVGFHAVDIQWRTPGVSWEEPAARGEDMIPETEPRPGEPEWPISTPL
jgi:hypothetical protein